MANRFTEKAQNVLNNALGYARDLGHTYIGSEHVLLSLCAESESVAAKMLAKHGVTADKVKIHPALGMPRALFACEAFFAVA